MSNLRSFPNAIKYALVITVDNYQGLRDQGYPGFDDIEETKADRQQHLDGLPHLGFEPENIIDLNNPTREEVHAKVTELRNVILDNAANGKRSFLYSYFGGAGATIGAPGQVIVLNGADKHVGYPLESRLEVLSSCNGMVCVAMVFDCSRVPLSPGLGRGENDEAEAAEWAAIEGGFNNRSRNLLVYRSAPAGMQAPPASPVAAAFFEHLKNACKKNGKSSTMDLINFTRYTEVS